MYFLQSGFIPSSNLVQSSWNWNSVLNLYKFWAIFKITWSRIAHMQPWIFEWMKMGGCFWCTKQTYLEAIPVEFRTNCVCHEKAKNPHFLSSDVYGNSGTRIIAVRSGNFRLFYPIYEIVDPVNIRKYQVPDFSLS